jgi:hypothetical protein
MFDRGENETSMQVEYLFNLLNTAIFSLSSVRTKNTFSFCQNARRAGIQEVNSRWMK